MYIEFHFHHIMTCDVNGELKIKKPVKPIKFYLYPLKPSFSTCTPATLLYLILPGICPEVLQSQLPWGNTPSGDWSPLHTASPLSSSCSIAGPNS